MKPKVIMEPGKHNEQNVVWIAFPKDEQLMAAVKSLGVAQWNDTQRRWYILEDKFRLNNVFNALQKLAFVDYSELNSSEPALTEPVKEQQRPIRPQKQPDEILLTEQFRRWMQHKRYSTSTIKTYT